MQPLSSDQSTQLASRKATILLERVKDNVVCREYVPGEVPLGLEVLDGTFFVQMTCDDCRRDDARTDRRRCLLEDDMCFEAYPVHLPGD